MPCKNRRANDTSKSPFSFFFFSFFFFLSCVAPRHAGGGVNTRHINTEVPNLKAALHYFGHFSAGSGEARPAALERCWLGGDRWVGRWGGSQLDTVNNGCLDAGES